MLHEEITKKILEASFDVMNELGCGFLESVYQNALFIAFRQKGLKVIPQAPFNVVFQGKNVGKFFADFFVEDLVIVELKCVDRLASEHQAQVINYLKASGVDTGLLLNFARPRVEFRRLYKPPLKVPYT